MGIRKPLAFWRQPARPLRPLPQVFGANDVAVDEWSVASPPLPSEGAYDDPSPWGKLLSDLTKSRGDAVSLSRAMRCAAAEIGRFHMKNHALPVASLRRFILARCGGETASFAPVVWSVEAPAAVPEPRLRARDDGSVWAWTESHGPASRRC